MYALFPEVPVTGKNLAITIVRLSNKLSSKLALGKHILKWLQNHDTK